MKIIEMLLQACLRMAELCLRLAVQLLIIIVTALVNMLVSLLTKSRTSRKQKDWLAPRVRQPSQPKRRKKQWPKTLH